MGRAEFIIGSKGGAVAGADRLPALRPAVAARLLCGRSRSEGLEAACMGGAEPRLRFTRHRFAVLVLLYSIPFSSPVYIFLIPVLHQSLEYDGKCFWTLGSDGALKNCRVCHHSSNNAGSLKMQCGFCRTRGFFITLTGDLWQDISELIICTLRVQRLAGVLLEGSGGLGVLLE